MSDHELIRAYEEALPIALLRTREIVMSKFRPLLSKYDISEQQWHVIRSLEDSGQAVATTLSERCCILMPSLSRMLKSLERDGLVTRNKLASDGRQQTIKLTAKGMKLFNKMAVQSEKIYADIEAEHGTENIKKLVTDLAKLQNSLKK